jgi:hypothetical protein
MSERERQARPAAHRLRDERRALDAEMVEQRAQVIGERRAAGPAGDVGRHAEAAMVERHAGEALAEVRHLLPPRQMVAADAVREDEGRRPARLRAVQLVVQLDVACGRVRHARRVASKRGKLDAGSWIRTDATERQ